MSVGKDLPLRYVVAGKWQVPGRNVVVPQDPPPPPPDPTDPTPPPVTPTVTTLLSTNWASVPVGPLNTTAGLAAFRAGLGDSNVAGTTNLANASIISDATKGKAYRQSFAASTGDGLAVFADGPFTGLNITDATISMDLRFNGGLGWGCKIPGLGGVNSLATGPSEVTGGKVPISENGWSGRHMFLSPGSGETKTNPDFAIYSYHYGQGDQFGDDLLFGTGPVVGQWYTLTTRYKLNSVVNGVPQPDGILTSTWNGVTRVNRAPGNPAPNGGYIFRKTADIPINWFYWAIFWGGADKAAWAPTVASSIDITNILITTPGA